ncbi:MAG TPA: hypothetical protein VGE07_13965 [Herpetosiphonaceae bacterium]
MSKPSAKPGQPKRTPAPPQRKHPIAGPRLPILPARMSESLHRSCQVGIYWRIGWMAVAWLAAIALVASIVLDERPGQRGEALRIAGPPVLPMAAGASYLLIKSIRRLRWMTSRRLELDIALTGRPQGPVSGSVELRGVGVIPRLTGRLFCVREVWMRSGKSYVWRGATVYENRLFAAKDILLHRDRPAWRHGFGFSFPHDTPRNGYTQERKPLRYVWFIELNFAMDDKRSYATRFQIPTT